MAERKNLQCTLALSARIKGSRVFKITADAGNLLDPEEKHTQKNIRNANRTSSRPHCTLKTMRKSSGAILRVVPAGQTRKENVQRSQESRDVETHPSSVATTFALQRRRNQKERSTQFRLCCQQSLPLQALPTSKSLKCPS